MNFIYFNHQLGNFNHLNFFLETTLLPRLAAPRGGREPPTYLPRASYGTRATLRILFNVYLYNISYTI